MRDDLFRTPTDNIKDFDFDDDVAVVFDDMLDRSIPFYSEVQRMAAELSVHFLAGFAGTVYDVGCSTGNTLINILDVLEPADPVQLVGIEPSVAMRDKFTEKLTARGYAERVTLWADLIEQLRELPDAQHHRDRQEARGPGKCPCAVP